MQLPLTAQNAVTMSMSNKLNLVRIYETTSREHSCAHAIYDQRYYNRCYYSSVSVATEIDPE